MLLGDVTEELSVAKADQQGITIVLRSTGSLALQHLDGMSVYALHGIEVPFT